MEWVVGSVALLTVAGLVHALRMRPEPYCPVECLSNLKNLAMAISMYVTDYDAPPDPRRWCDQTAEYIRSKEIYKCPEAPGLVCGYALNTGVKGASSGNMATGATGAKTVTIFESDVGWNAHGGRELLPAEPRHLGGDNYGFLEGSARWMKREAAEGLLRWEVGGGG